MLTAVSAEVDQAVGAARPGTLMAIIKTDSRKLTGTIMSLPTAYLVTTKNLDSFLNALKTAKAPERVTNKFLQNLEFSSSNDRLFIGMLKSLGFTDESGVPAKRYFDFLDQSQSARILADAVREAYSDLFAVNVKANELSAEEVKNKLRTLTQGKNSDDVLGWMAKTFKALADLADWSNSSTAPPPTQPPGEAGVAGEDDPGKQPPVKPVEEQHREGPTRLRLKELHYNIQIVLPETRDVAVFDAIFESLKKHLL